MSADALGPRHGFTFVEVLFASLIGSVVAGGTFMAFVTAARIVRQQGSGSFVEATSLAQETIEGFRNQIGAQANPADLPWPGANVGTWQQGAPVPVSSGLSGATRVYCVFQADCNGDGDTDDVPLGGDCYAVHVKVCWDGTVCPTALPDTPADMCQ